MTKKRPVPPMCKPGKRISITLTVGQQLAIEKSIVFALVGRDHQKVVRHWMTNAILESVALEERKKLERRT